MNQRRKLFTIFCLLFALTAASVSTADAQVYSGRATGVNAVVTINGTPTNTSVADTCPLSPTGGSHIATTPVGVVPGIVRTGPITSTTSGAGSSSQSSSTVQDLNFGVFGYTVRAASVASTTQCNCCVPSQPACSGRTTIAGLTVTDPSGVTTAITPSGAVGQTVALGASGTLTINEQAATPGAVTVNALRINITGPNGSNVNVVVASSHSDIECLSTGPTAADVPVSGRVLDPNGRGVSRASVTLTDGERVLTAQTGSTGGFSFPAVESGGTYILTAAHPSYTFAPVPVPVLEEVTNLVVRADSSGTLRSSLR